VGTTVRSFSDFNSLWNKFEEFQSCAADKNRDDPKILEELRVESILRNDRAAPYLILSYELQDSHLLSSFESIISFSADVK
jgi:hypothetical protein